MSTLTATKVSSTTSLRLLNTLLTVSFGCLAFLRGLFPDDSFVDQRYVASPDSNSKRNSIRIKSISRGATKESDIYLDWLEQGVFHAVANKYLRALVLSIFEDPSKPENIIESYTFSFIYSNDSSDFKLKLNDIDLSLDDARKSLQLLMRRFILITQSLQPLPDKKFLSMHMLFNDNCPLDYQPPHFKDASDEKTPFFTGCVDEHIAGCLKTPYHSVSVKVMTLPEFDEDTTMNLNTSISTNDPFCENIPITRTTTSNNIEEDVKKDKNESELKLKSYLQNSKFKEDDICSTQVDEEIQNHHTSIIKQNDNNDLILNENLNCHCDSKFEISNLNSDSNEIENLLKCTKCFKLYHKQCYGYSTRSNISTSINKINLKFSCYNCLSIDLSKIPKFYFLFKKIFLVLTEDGLPNKLSFLHTNICGFSLPNDNNNNKNDINDKNLKTIINIINILIELNFLKLIETENKNEFNKSSKKKISSRNLPNRERKVNFDISGIKDKSGKLLSLKEYNCIWIPRNYKQNLTLKNGINYSELTLIRQLLFAKLNWNKVQWSLEALSVIYNEMIKQNKSKDDNVIQVLESQDQDQDISNNVRAMSKLNLDDDSNNVSKKRPLDNDYNEKVIEESSQIVSEDDPCGFLELIKNNKDTNDDDDKNNGDKKIIKKKKISVTKQNLATIAL